MNRQKGKQLGKYVPDYFVFDLETTGINVNRDQIIEISSLKVVQGKVVKEFSTLVNPHRHIPEAASAVNHITDELVADAPELEEALGNFLSFIGDGILVGHNIHNFDTNFVYDAVWSLFGRAFSNNYVDTLFVARKCLPQLPHHTLGDISQYFHISTQGAHRALADCYMNQRCYEELGKLLPGSAQTEDEQPVCPECGSLLRRRKGRYGEFWGCSGYPFCRYTRAVR